MKQQQGQTLIETVIGIFILIMGISAAVGLASFSLYATSNVTQQLIGTALAREGIEAIRNMRDTNWLQIQTIDQDCYNYESPGSNDGLCYEDWQTQFYDIDPNGSNTDFTLDAHTTVDDDDEYWELNNPTGPPADRFKLYYDSTAASGTFYTPDSSGGKPFSGLYRQVLIEEDATPSYYQASIGPRLNISSRVWWTGQRCLPASTYDAAAPSCRLQIASFLTNWRNY